MKKVITILTALSLPAFAGSGKEVVTEPEPSLAEWFAGGSFGYLLDFDEPMYHLHLGQDTGHQLGGWDFSWFLEIGYTTKEESGGGSAPPPIISPGDSFDVDGLEAAIAGTGASFDLDIMPITINTKFEKALNESFTAYLGAGVGLANVDLNIAPSVLSDDEWVFAAQAFAGVIYNLNTDWELYGGARWIYLEDADLGPATLELEDDVLVELGVRRNF